MDASAEAPGERFLDELAPHDRDALRGRAGQRRFRPGSTLMHEGQIGSEVFILLSGRVKVTYLTRDGREVVLDFRGPGDLLGELAVIDGRPRASTVEALEPVEALAIAAPDFTRLMREHPGLVLSLLQSMTRRFRYADRRRIEFAALKTTGRVASRLVELVERYGKGTERGFVIDLPITQEELAGWTASSREAAAKALHQLRELGLIETERRRITVLDLEALGRQTG